MEYVLVPLANLWGIPKKKLATRFAEQAWLWIYANTVWPIGLYIYYNSPYFFKMDGLWTNWPDRELDGLLKAYVMVQWSFWIQQILVVHIEDRRKDHWQMLTHHFVTVTLISASYAYHQSRVGSLILWLMDVVDLSFPLAKCLKYLGFTTICDILFGIFTVSFFVARHVIFLTICWSIYADIPRVITSGCYIGNMNNLSGPYAVPDDWSHVFQPFLNPEGIVCWNDNIKNAFLGTLLVLQVITAIWFVAIVRVVIRVLRGGSAEDIRSDDECEEEIEYEELPPLEEEVGVEEINLLGWERRSGGKRGASASGVTFSSTRKELLNRVGCEKQIDGLE
ncbi:putative Sphingosine N-acyltransferase lag1 [Glarea lozoyensis 74030]|nr:putative Sphingosine N-acyltransferase lag1 [Glarea lozoyensis 74030]